MANDTHIKFDGVDGESTHNGHKGEIDVLSWNWGLSNASSAATGSGSGKGKAVARELSFTHNYDKASPVLKKHCASGKHFDKVVLTSSKAGEGQLAFLTKTMKEVFITDIYIGGSSGGDITETVRLSFTDIELEYKAQDGKGGLGGAVKFGWDVAKVLTR
jgi:type VI secretion system secreted protein Hcp